MIDMSPVVLTNSSLRSYSRQRTIAAGVGRAKPIHNAHNGTYVRVVNRVWAVGPETHHAGVYQGTPYEGSEYIMLAIEDNAEFADKPELRDIYFSDPP